MRGSLSYYKWHIIFGIIVLICVIFVLGSIFNKTPADMKIAYLSEKHMNVQYFRDAKEEIEMLLHDANRDSIRYADVEAFSSKKIEELSEKMKQFIESKECTMIVADKSVFENIENKSVFQEVTQYMIKDEDLSYLTDENGIVYATSLANNSLVKRLGMVENQNLYMAVLIKTENGEKTSDMKNAMNISGYIIENKNKYQM